MSPMFGCERCLLLVRVVDDEENIHSLIRNHPNWKEGLLCPDCGGEFQELKGRLRKDAQKLIGKDVFRTFDLSAQEFFSSLCGLGFPDELHAAPEVIGALLKMNSVVDVECKIHNGNHKRTVIDRIHLSDGTTLHFTGSPVHGAVVYKVTRRKAEGGRDVERTE